MSADQQEHMGAEDPMAGEDMNMGGAADGAADGSGMDEVHKQNLQDLLVVAVAIIVATLSYMYMSQGSAVAAVKVTPPKQLMEYVNFKEELLSGKDGEEGREVADLEVEEVDALKKKLMSRAFHTIPLIMEHQDKGALRERMYKRGMMSDDNTATKNFIDQEIAEVQGEAGEVLEGWGESIWAEAMSFYQKMQKKKNGEGGEGAEGDKK